MTKFRLQFCAALAATAGAAVLLPAAASAVPVLQLYVEGSTYDQDHESWVFSPAGGETIRLWVIGNVAAGGGQGTIEDVKISIVYTDPGSNVTITLTPSTTAGYNGIGDPSISAAPTYLQTVDDGSLPTLADGQPIAQHGVYGAGTEWQEFGLGDFALTDSPIGDFINDFPATLFANAGQINVYDLTVIGDVTDLHIDAYGQVYAGNHLRSVFAPYSHDAGTGVNDPVPVPEPTAASLFLAGLLGIGLMFRRRKPE
jgi:hypothetical protein